MAPIEQRPLEVQPLFSGRRIPSQPCTAHRSNGEPCGRWAIRGGTVCPTHGGSAKQVKAAARARLQQLVPLALDVLAELLEGVALDPATGQPVVVPPAVRHRAADCIVRSSGISAPEEIELAFSDQPRPDLDAAIEAALRRRDIPTD